MTKKMKSLKDALVTIRRSPYQSMLAILMTTITFFVAYTFSLAIAGTELTLSFFETRPQVIAFFDLETDKETINIVAKQFEEKTYVDEVKLITKEEALMIYRKENEENPLLLELVTANILPASIEISAHDVKYLQKIEEDLTKSLGIEEVIFRQDIVDSLTKWTNAIRITGITSISILIIISFLTMMTTISMKVNSKKSAIKIMKIIGANHWYIASPFVLEGTIYGIIGSLLGWAGMYALFLYLTPWIKDFLGSIILLPIPLEIFAWQLSIGTSIGILLGSFTSIIAVQRMLRKK